MNRRETLKAAALQQKPVPSILAHGPDARMEKPSRGNRYYGNKST